MCCLKEGELYWIPAGYAVAMCCLGGKPAAGMRRASLYPSAKAAYEDVSRMIPRDGSVASKSLLQTLDPLLGQFAMP